MNTYSVRLAMAFTATFVPGVAVAQHGAHQAGAQQAPTEMAQCARVQPIVDNIIAGGMARLESARQSNSPTEMRAAVDHLAAALRDIRGQLASCSAAAEAAEPRAGSTMPGAEKPPGAAAPATQTPAAVADPHAGHAKPAAPAAPRGSPSSQPAPSKPERPQKADPHAGHASGQQSAKPMDPVNGLRVDPATAPKTTYQGQTYYFSSEQTRKEFLENPGKFARKPKG